MRTSEQIAKFESEQRSKVHLDGFDEKQARRLTRLFDACVPRTFWDTKLEDITHNRAQFDSVVRAYCEKLATARRNGAGLLFLGPNGTGKTIFSSWVLRDVLTRTRWDGYYTTIPQYLHDYRRGWNDRERAERLEELVARDWLVLDELSKEHVRASDEVRSSIEQILKHRFDEGLPTVLATNATLTDLDEVLGESVASMIVGKSEQVVMEPGDFRKELGRRTKEVMGYGSR